MSVGRNKRRAVPATYGGASDMPELRRARSGLQNCSGLQASIVRMTSPWSRRTSRSETNRSRKVRRQKGLRSVGGVCSSPLPPPLYGPRRFAKLQGFNISDRVRITMYAIIEDGSRQLKVEEGQELDIDYRDLPAGEAITFDRVLAVRDEAGLEARPPGAWPARRSPPRWFRSCKAPSWSCRSSAAARTIAAAPATANSIPAS